MKPHKITLKNYDKLLAQVQNFVAATQSNVAKIVTRQKVEMAWNIGKSISQHLAENNNSEKGSYGKRLFEQLESDVGIAQSVLYKMRSFYQSYPQLPKDDNQLNWSHYRLLSGVKNEDDRKYLEDLTKKKDLGAADLQKKVTKLKPLRAEAKLNPKILKPKRGRLFCYNVAKREELGQTCIDCGFGVLKIIESIGQDLGKVVESVKENKQYSVQETALQTRKLNVYKAYVRRVVDGDTLHVTLDLGFEIFHEEILRLRGINAAESNSKSGRQSTEGLKEILKTIPFLIIKTTATDIYGRYVADVFLSDEKGQLPPQEVADSGLYLNQLLLDKGLANVFAS